MKEITEILIAALCVYGFYSILWEIRSWLRRFSARQKIDNETKKEYNNTIDKS